MEAVLPQRPPFDKEKDLVIPMFGSCRNRHIFTLFGMQAVQEILELNSKRSQDRQELPQGKAQFF